MHQTNKVLLMELDESTGLISSLSDLYMPEHLPIGIDILNGNAERGQLNAWWMSRSIPASRSGLHQALEKMKITSPLFLSIKCFGLSLSDQYWICPENEDLQWEKLNFFDNVFSEDVGNALFGSPLDDEFFSLVSPDNTSDGWLQKKWKIVGSKRCLIKGGSGVTRQEPYNEVIASAIMRRLLIPHAEYSLTYMEGYPYSICEDFITRETELISAWMVIQSLNKTNHTSNHQHYIDCCNRFSLDIISSLNQMIVLDFIIANEDRHYNNFGIIRDAQTLEWISAAPIFDCGTSLWFDKPNMLIRPFDKNLSSKPFKSTHDEQIRLVSDFSWLDFSSLNGIEDEVNDLLKGSIFIDTVRRDSLCYALIKRIEILQDYIHGKL